MELVINEFSLEGHFNSIDDFLDSLIDVIKIETIMKKTSLKLLKHYELYSSLVTKELTLHEILLDNNIRTRPEIRKFKRLLSTLINDPPYWNDDQRHGSSNNYYCDYTEKTHGYSLAEACERDRIVLSFLHNKFKEPDIKIKKNLDEVTLLNIYNPRDLLDFLYEMELIDSYSYCLYWFKDSKISMDLLDEDYGFSSLQKHETKIFISAMKLFDELSWDDIPNHEGLQYKQYQPSSNEDWFRNSAYNDKQIFKFRANQKLRCFGFREDNIMYILRFETDHKISDHG
ncbi:hypothetical protein OPHB3_1797 [Oceanobacillus picturae]|uniref:Uncharacterized protein n=1 Tax=Oceanobacillus picturae TaxID=171693 RepID=A0A0U9HCP5_9BACI|nr:hypothetical protein [Oceanobacillus picturae]GAQ17860.1 hypothetical protein OPHB3_1797 [Oceanobacillus picturae]